MRQWNCLYLVAALLGGSAAANGAVIISEVLANEVGSDTTGEFFEIFNTGATSVDISNFKIGDEETRGGDSEAGGMWKFPAGTTIAPGQVIVVTTSATRFNTVYGFKPDFEANVSPTDAAVPDMVGYTDWVNPPENNSLANGNDQAILLGDDDSIVDSVSWNTAGGTNVITSVTADGQSYRRKFPIQDTDSIDDWELSPDTGVAATRSSPGVVPEPASLSLLGLGAIAAVARRRRA